MRFYVLASCYVESCVQAPCIAKSRAPITPTLLRTRSPIHGYAAATELSRPPSFPQNDMQRRRLLIRSVGERELNILFRPAPNGVEKKYQIGRSHSHI